MIYLDKLKDKIASVPDAPGVYIFKDSRGEIIYIGKAKSLNKRVQSYFTRYLSSKTQALITRVADIEYKLTPSEAQAQLLEASLIKEKQPQYNISLKDDKSFPLIRITQENFPLISISRRKKLQKKDTSLYLGPYTNAQLLRQALKMIRQIFGFRSCKKIPRQACLYWRLKLCPAPCIGKVDSRQYKETINQIKLFLESRYQELLNRLAYKMQAAAKEKRFEEAAKIRDQINALSAIGKNTSHISAQGTLEDLKNLLKLDKLPARIEAFDISNIFGKEACGSMVSFHKGLADKNNYRRFRIKTVLGIDDYKMLREVIHRRYLKVIEEKSPFPDLILIDGGRSHLLTAQKELKQLGLQIPLVSIAKGQENIYIQGKLNPIRLDSDTPALNLIRRIRDEAHRFALSYHHVLRRKKTLGR